MGRTKPRASQRPQKPVLVECPAQEPVNLADIRQKIVVLVANHAISMVESTIGQVDEGNHAAMKYLFELVGLSAAAPEGLPKQNALATLMLQRLMEAEIPKSVNTTGKDAKITAQSPTQSP